MHSSTCPSAHLLWKLDVHLASLDGVLHALHFLLDVFVKVANKAEPSRLTRINVLLHLREGV